MSKFHLIPPTFSPSTEELIPLSELRLPPTENSDQMLVLSVSCLNSVIAIANVL